MAHPRYDQGFFHKSFGGGGGGGILTVLLSGTILGPRRAEADVRGGALSLRRQMTDEGDLKKMSAAEAKNPPYSKIRAYFGVLSINKAF